MPTILADLTFVTLVSDVDTPAPLVQHNGKIVGVPPDVPIPAFGELFGIPGRKVMAGQTITWVMTAPVDFVAVGVDAIPGPTGWKDLAARDVYITNARALLSAGITGTAVKARLPQLYSAAVSNHIAP